MRNGVITSALVLGQLALGAGCSTASLPDGGDDARPPDSAPEAGDGAGSDAARMDAFDADPDALPPLDAARDAGADADLDAALDAPPGSDARDVGDDAPDPRVPIAEFSGFGEISGLQASRRYPGIIWGHRDGSGVADDPLRTSIYAFRIVDGRLDRSYHPAGYRRFAAAGGVVLNRNWEDIGISRESDGSYALWLGDIGNNGGSRNFYQIYKFREPDPERDTTATLLATYSFQYPASAMVAGAWPNCESMFLLDGVPYIVTKAETSEIYRFPSAPGGAMATLAYVGRVREPASGFANLSYVDVSADGTRAVVGTHRRFWVYTGGDASLRGDAFVTGLLATRPPAFERLLTDAMISGAVNFEGAAFMADSYDVVLGSESQSVLYFRASQYE